MLTIEHLMTIKHANHHIRLSVPFRRCINMPQLVVSLPFPASGWRIDGNDDEEAVFGAAATLEVDAPQSSPAIASNA
jgi:hypothetical protein